MRASQRGFIGQCVIWRRIQQCLILSFLLAACGSTDNPLPPAELPKNVTTIALASDGDIYVGGKFTSYNGVDSRHIIRLNPDRTADPAFAVEAGFDDFVAVIAATGDGDIYVGGEFTRYSGVNSSHIIRLNPDGAIDTGFIVGTGFNDFVSTIALARDNSGDIYVGGSFSNYKETVSNRIIRLNNNGTVDTGFNVGTGFNFSPNSIAVAGDGTGDIYVVGSFTMYNGTVHNRIVRLNPDGTVDTGFFVETGFNSAVYAIALAGNGDIYASGTFVTYDGLPSNYLVRLHSNGKMDQEFAVGTGFNHPVFAIGLAVDGDIYAGGGFTLYHGLASPYIVRLNSNGRVDKGFAVGTSFNDFVSAMTLDSTGNIYVGGNFILYNTTVVDKITRLNTIGGVN